MDCLFEKVDDRYVCENCKFATLIPKLKRNCRPAAPPQLPTIPSASRQAFNFTVASIRHVMGGMPTRSQQEIDAIMATCRACELFVPQQDDPELGVSGHKKCGCTLTQQRRFISKVGWRSQHCPLEKW